VADLGAKAASDPNSLLFRHKDLERFAAVHDWLCRVVQPAAELTADHHCSAYRAVV
jgi:hypothetical protein